MEPLPYRPRHEGDSEKALPSDAGPSTSGINGKSQSSLERLPAEILYAIFSFLRNPDLVQLLVVSRTLRLLVEDSSIWRLRCSRKSLVYIQELKADPRSLDTSGPALPEEIQFLRKWDYSDPKEAIDWRKEYEGRHTINDLDWSCGIDGTLGVGLYQDYQKRLLIAPYASRGILYWDIDNYDAQLKLRIKRQSTSHVNSTANNFQVDNSSKSFFLATGYYVQQCDLETSEVISCARFPQQITAISSLEPRLPVTIGTTSCLFLWDPRVRHWADEDEYAYNAEDAYTESDRPALKSEFNPSKNRYAMPSVKLPDHEPLTILTAPEPIGHNVFVSGRFPAILDYDRRYFSRPRGYTHAGMNVCDMTISSVHRGRGNSLQISACGDSKGSGAEANFVYDTSNGVFHTMQSVRRAYGTGRELCIVRRGQHLLASDLQGEINFRERDTLSPLRHIPTRFPDNIIRRMVVADPECGNSDVLLWDGDKVGIMRTGRSARMREAYTNESLREARKLPATPPDREAQMKLDYEERMRKVLERHADEMNLMSLYGL